MTDRALPSVNGAPACPFVAFDDARDDRSDRPDPRHRCYAENPPSARARAHQEAYCLSATFPVCPTFQDWARREAAKVTPSAGVPANPATRLRDVPAQREAGGRPPSFDAPLRIGPSGPPAGPTPALTTRPAAGTGPSIGGVASRGTGAEPPEPEDAAGIQGADDERVREPWDLPARRPAPPDWSMPPPWVAGGPTGIAEPGTAGTRPPAGPAFPRGDVMPEAGPGGVTRPPRPDSADAPNFLRAQPPAADRRVWGRRPPAEPKDSGLPAGEADIDVDAGAEPAGLDTVISRLRAMGMGAEDEPDEAFGAARPVRGAARPTQRPGGWPDDLEPFDEPDIAGPARGARAGRPAIGAAGTAATGTPEAEPPARASRGLARILGWDRRPKAGAGRPQRREEREPSWERPRRFEAYPTLKTRVGLPAPSRLLLAAAALLVAAMILFFVPPLFLRQAGTIEPGTSASPSTSVAPGSARPSAARTSAPTPKQVTYTVRQGDTLSSIAKKFKLTVDEILAANKQIKNPNRIAAGDVIVIPSPAPTEIVDGAPSGT